MERMLMKTKIWGFWGLFLLRVITLLSFLSFVSCSLEVGVSDVGKYQLKLTKATEKVYTNKTEYNLEWDIKDEKGETPFADSSVYKLKVFENGSCEGDPLKVEIFEQHLLQSFALKNLENNKIYSAQVVYEHESESFTSECTAPIVVDFDAPVSVTYDYPVADHYIGETDSQVRLNPTVDVGIAGMHDETPYYMTLVEGLNCSGQELQTVPLNKVHHFFHGLENGKFYSIKTFAMDRAGNKTSPICSNNIEIDVYVPSVTISDPLSSPGYSRTLNPQITVGNTTDGHSWCITEDTGFNPASTVQACPGGSWVTSLPSNHNLSGGEGDKTVHVWMADSDGLVMSTRPGVYQIDYDVTPSGNFSIVGVGGSSDSRFDEWLYSTVLPSIRWNASTDAFEYEIVVKNSSNAVVCSPDRVYHPQTQADLECELDNGETYTIEMIAYDRAQNPQPADSTFSFTVDLDAPSSFDILGLRGGADLLADAWFGVSLPQVHYNDASGEDLYLIRILDVNDQEVCTQEQENLNVLLHDFSLSAPAVCQALNHGDFYKAEVIASDLAGNETPANNNLLLFQVDHNSPQLSFLSTPNTLEQIGSTSFSFQYSDDDSGVGAVECELNGGGYSSCSTPHNLVGLTENNYTLNVRVSDIVGNLSIISHSWTVDLSLPVLTVSSYPAAKTNQTLSSFSFSAADISGIQGYECNLNSGGFSSCTSPHNVTLSQGTHSMIIRATDNSGDSDSEIINWLIDTTVPTISITSNPALEVNSTSASFQFSAADSGGAGVDHIECQLDGGSWGVCTSPQNYSSLASSSHTFNVRSHDQAGNISSVASYSWLIDTTVPTISITSNPALEVNSTSASFQFSAADSGGAGVDHIECQLDSGAWGTCTSPRNYSSLSSGNHTFNVRSHDQAGNISSVASYSWLIDTTVPTISITSNPALEVNSTSASFQFSAADSGGAGVDHIECQLDSGAWGTCTSPQSYSSLAAGNRTFRVRSHDQAGNISSVASYSWLIDTTVPTISITSNPALEVNSTSASFQFSAADSGGSGLDHIECRLDGGSWGTCTSPRNYSSLSASSHTFNVRSHDQAGNISSVASYSWLIDTTAPTVSITSNPGLEVNSTSASFQFSASDSGSGIAYRQCQLDSGSWGTCTSPRNYSSLSAGTHTFRVRAYDDVGYVSNTASYSWLIDTTAPVTSITSTPPSTTSSSSASFSFSRSDSGGSGINYSQCRLDGGSWSTCTSPRVYTVGIGSHTFNVRTIDQAGNIESYKSYSWTRYNPCSSTATFHSSTSWTVPSNVSKVCLKLWGAGGGAGGGGGGSDGDGGNGGGGAYVYTEVTVTPGQVLSLTVGGGGHGGAAECHDDGGCGGGAGGYSRVTSGSILAHAGGGGGGGGGGDHEGNGGVGNGGGTGSGWNAGAGQRAPHEDYGGAGGAGGLKIGYGSNTSYANGGNRTPGNSGQAGGRGYGGVGGVDENSGTAGVGGRIQILY